MKVNMWIRCEQLCGRPTELRSIFSVSLWMINGNIARNKKPWENILHRNSRCSTRTFSQHICWLLAIAVQWNAEVVKNCWNSTKTFAGKTNFDFVLFTIDSLTRLHTMAACEIRPICYAISAIHNVLEARCAPLNTHWNRVRFRCRNFCTKSPSTITWFSSPKYFSSSFRFSQQCIVIDAHWF